MNRTLTNTIRFFMDECIPPIIRDSKLFMYPFFYMAYGGKNIEDSMHFKSRVYEWTEKEYVDFYSQIDSISRNRKTDLNEGCIDYIKNNIHPEAKSLVDIGCGKGYFLQSLENTGLELHGCDIVDKREYGSYQFTEGNIERLPFPDKSFDVITCSHTIEHILHPEQAIAELKRVARKQVFITVPCQRYFYYTLDEHVNFFPFKEKLTSLIDMKDHECKKIWGDWVYLGKL